MIRFIDQFFSKKREPQRDVKLDGTTKSAKNYIISIQDAFTVIDNLDDLLVIPFVEPRKGVHLSLTYEFRKYGAIQIVFLIGESEPLCAKITSF